MDQRHAQCGSVRIAHDAKRNLDGRFSVKVAAEILAENLPAAKPKRRS